MPTLTGAEESTSRLSAACRELALDVGVSLRGRALCLVTAESCTGGLIAAHITAISGSSDYFVGGVVAYANAVKVGVLGVSAETLEKHGAVSWQTAVQMAWGARDLLGTDLALATTGIAGPTGGTATKPVGLVYIALATDEKVWWHRLQWHGARDENNLRTVSAALMLLQHYLHEGTTSLPAEMSCESGVMQRPARAVGAPSSMGLPVNVEFTTRPDGTWRVVAFHRQGQRHVVTGRGRSWEDALGRKHYLAMTPALGTVELVFDPTASRWGLTLVAPPRATV